MLANCEKPPIEKLHRTLGRVIKETLISEMATFKFDLGPDQWIVTVQLTKQLMFSGVR